MLHCMRRLRPKILGLDVRVRVCVCACVWERTVGHRKTARQPLVLMSFRMIILGVLDGSRIFFSVAGKQHIVKCACLGGRMSKK